MTEIALSDRTPLAETHTVLQVGSRTFKSGPAGTVISGVAFWGWQIHPLPPDDGDRYLVRTDYDLNILPNAPEAAAVDVGFRFLTPGVAVLDAIPRGVSTMEGPASYILTDHLNFVRSAGGSTQTAWPDGSARPEIPLPALRPAVEIFGVGGPDLKWRHTATSSAPIRVGSHSGWFVLALPASVDLIHVQAQVVYHSTPDYEVGLVLSTAPAEFTVRLPAGDRPVPPAVTRSAVTPGQRRDPTGDEVRLMFSYDVVGYSGRDVAGQREAQDRLARLARLVVADLGASVAAGDTQSAGDSVTVLLPAGTDVAQALPRLLHASARWLGEDNARHADRLRLRMAVAFGPTRSAALGFDGPTIVECHRLLDCDAVRDPFRAHPEPELAVIVSDIVHRLFVAPRYPDLDPERFARVEAVVKGYQEPAWLWLHDRWPTSVAAK